MNPHDPIETPEQYASRWALFRWDARRVRVDVHHLLLRSKELHNKIPDWLEFHERGLSDEVYLRTCWGIVAACSDPWVNDRSYEMGVHDSHHGQPPPLTEEERKKLRNEILRILVNRRPSRS